MKNLINLSKYLCIVLLMFSIFSCNKSSDDDSIPKVKTLSLENLPDGTIKVTGIILPESKSSVTSFGFCYDNYPEPHALRNQEYSSFNSDGSTFTAIYQNLDVSQRLYFRAWAENNNGYGYGEAIALDSLYVEPVVAPCNRETNKFSAGSFPVTLNDFSIQEETDQKVITASGSQGKVKIRIAKPANTGIYETSINTFGNKVFLLFESGFNTYVIKPGYQVYVNKIGNQYEITCCLGKYTLVNNTPDVDFWCKIKTN